MKLAGIKWLTFMIAVLLISLVQTCRSLAQEEGPTGKAEEKKEEQKPFVLPPVTVTAPPEKGYTESTVTVGSKIPTEIREIPQSVSVVTRQRIEDQNFTTVADAMKQTTGMTVQRFDGTGHLNQIFARGYQIDSVQLDGVTANSRFVQAGPGFDMAIYDRIEVLRGPAGLFQGAGEPGGVINLVRKRPERRFSVSGAFSGGSRDNYRGNADITGPLLKSGRLRGRLVTGYQNQRSFVDVLKTKDPFVYGTVDLDLTDSTTFSLGGAFQAIDSLLDQGLPAFANGRLLDVSRSTLIGADWNRQDIDRKDGFSELEHRFCNGGHVKLSARYLGRSVINKNARANGAVNPNTGQVTIQTVLFKPELEDITLDIHANNPIEFGGQTHNLLLGADYRSHQQEASLGLGPNHTMNVFAPDHGLPEPNIAITNKTRDKTEQYGAYSQACVKPLNWATVVLGGRVSWWDAQSKNLLTRRVTSEANVQHEFTPYGGLVVDLTKWLSVYSSYAEIFQPQTQLDTSSKILPPRIGAQYEAGVKAEFFDKKLNAHIAAFRIQDKNRALRIPDCVGSLCFEAAAKVQSWGVEAEISGRLLPGWDIFTGYAFTTTKFLKAAVTQQGQTFSTFTPEHIFNLWTRYEFQHGLLNGFSLGGGVKASAASSIKSGRRASRKTATW